MSPASKHNADRFVQQGHQASICLGASQCFSIMLLVAACTITMPSRVDALLLCVCCAGCLICLFPVYAQLSQYFCTQKIPCAGCGCYNKRTVLYIEPPISSSTGVLHAADRAQQGPWAGGLLRHHCALGLRLQAAHSGLEAVACTATRERLHLKSGGHNKRAWD